MWLETLKDRNVHLLIFGAFNLSLAILFFIFSRFSDVEIMGVNAWYKPIKFALSIGIFSLTMAWYTGYLESDQSVIYYNWGIILTLGFEIIYIAIQAGRGELSHYNQTTPFFAIMYVFMALAATIATLWTGWIGLRFFTEEFPQLPDYYLWAIRLGIILFVIFSLEGFVMGSRLSHTIGGSDGGSGLPFLNWSFKYGDPRVAHFIGMHALQILPVLSFYVIKNVRITIFGGIIYGLLAGYVLWVALQGQSLFRLFTVNKF